MDTSLASTEDYYALLSVPANASIDLIKSAYRTLALRYHPDKNNDATATETFQRLSRAWDTLRDAARRAEYDRERARRAGGLRVRWSTDVRDGDIEMEWDSAEDQAWERERQLQRDRDNEEAHRAALSARQRRLDIDRAVMASWWAACEEGNGVIYTSTGQRIFPDEAGRRQRARVWKAVVREDYLGRLWKWLSEREMLLGGLREVRVVMGRREVELRALEGAERANVARVFMSIHQNIASHRRANSASNQASPDPHYNKAPLPPELENTTAHKLIQAIGHCRKRARQIIHDVSTSRRNYEEGESRTRQIRVNEALDILGPRDINPPLFCAIDRRGRTINQWRALGRVKTSRKFGTLEGTGEGAWHAHGEWLVLMGDGSCGRCERGDSWHFLGEGMPKRCPGCGVVVCGECERELSLLREYERWVVGEEDIHRNGKGEGDRERDNLFSLDFDWNESGYS